MVKQGVPKKIRVLTNRYVRLLNDRKITEAEKVMEKIKEGLTPKPWNMGYYNALEGMATALKSRDSLYLYIGRIDVKDKKRMSQLQKDFSMKSRNPLLDDFDRGYFTAWLEYIRVLKSQEESTEPLNAYLSND